MKNYLIKLFGNFIKINKVPTAQNVPLYLVSGRNFYEITLYDVPFIVVEVSDNEKFSAIAYKKHAAKLSDTYSKNIAFVFKTMTKSQRNSLMNNLIPFIYPEEQVFLPFIGIILNERFRNTAQYNIEKMMPVTQMLFLYLAYSSSDDVIKSVAADDLGLSRPNITRASSQLRAMGLITEYKTGKEAHMLRIAKGWEYYKFAEQFLINPVHKKVMVKTNHIDLSGPIAGYCALSQFSMLNPPKYKIQAIFKGNKDINKLTSVDSRWESEEVTEVELWKYDPNLFSKAGVIDPISMLCSITADDERTENAISEVMEMKLW